jgi:hypothetical protein
VAEATTFRDEAVARAVVDVGARLRD